MFFSPAALLTDTLSLSQLASSFSGESVLPPNLLLPTNLVDPSRLSKSKQLTSVHVN